MLLWISTSAFAQKPGRIVENFDFDWKFSLSDDADYSKPGFGAKDWLNVQLPHDWNIKQDFVREAGGSAAYLPEGIGWYRKTFKLPKNYQGRKVFVLFGGISMRSDVYINGQHLGFHPYAYSSIEYDLTPYLDFNKENVIAVRVNTTGGRPRWYGGAGIYRHVRLLIVNPVHVATYGTYVTTPNVSAEKADVNIVTTLSNQSKFAQSVLISQKIIDISGKKVSESEEKKISIAGGEKIDLQQTMVVSAPKLWSIEEPNMYQMETIVKSGKKTVDVYTTPFGIRTFRFDKDKGFFLNGEHVKLKGMCLHEDAGVLGVAVPDRANERKLEILKEYGCNAIRCAHNPPSTEFLDLCDRLGFVVIDEAFDKWTSGYYEKYFDDWWQSDLRNMILRDKNHPSIALWSIGNEVREAGDSSDTGATRAAMLRDFVKQLEPTRPTTLAAQNGHNEKIASVPDVIGYNYLEARMISEKKKYPERIALVSEELPYFRGEEGRIRSYTPLNPWELVEENDFVAGGFIWSGVDYLGEASWPGKGWPNGLFDICMNEKPRAAYHRAKWNSKPMVRIAVADQNLDVDHGRDLWQWPNIAGHWNFPQKYQGLTMEIYTTTNCDSVELFFDNQSMGKKKTANFTNNTIVWYLPYKPGKLKAIGINADERVASYTLVTSKTADHAVIEVDRSDIKADGQDLSFISIQLVDKDGNTVQTDDKKVAVLVKGDGKFMGIENGDLRREKSFAGNELKTYFGKALVIVQSTRISGIINVQIRVEGVDKPYEVTVHSR